MPRPEQDPIETEVGDAEGEKEEGSESEASPAADPGASAQQYEEKPLLEAVREAEKSGQEIDPESPLGQRFQQYLDDIKAAQNGDVDAYVRVGTVNQNPPSAEDIKKFQEAGGPPVLSATREATSMPSSGLASRTGRRPQPRTSRSSWRPARKLRASPASQVCPKSRPANP
jgi:hypothetical protein